MTEMREQSSRENYGDYPVKGRDFMKKGLQKLALALCAALVMTSFAACSAKEEANNSSQENTSPVSSTTVEKELVNVAALKGPTAIGMAKLMGDNDSQQTQNQYNFTIAAAADDIVGKLTSGEVDIAAIPTNLAATLYQKTNGGIQMLAVNTLGVLYLTDSTGEIQSVDDLKGKTIYASGEGSVPQYVFDYILAQNGIDPQKDVTIEYKTEHSELATLAISGDAPICVLPEPFVTQVKAKNSNITAALDLTEEWEKVTDGKYQLAMGCIVVRKGFLDEHKEAVDKFLSEYKASTEYANSNIEQTAKIVGEKDIMPEEVAKQAIPNCNIVFLSGEEMKQSVSGFYQVLMDFQPKSIGGKLPDDAFYYQQ